jgi:hypothetical protein
MKASLAIVVALGVACCYLLATASAQANPCAGATLQHNCGACFNASTTDVKCGYCIAFLTSDYWYLPPTPISHFPLQLCCSHGFHHLKSLRVLIHVPCLLQPPRGDGWLARR